MEKILTGKDLLDPLVLVVCGAGGFVYKKRIIHFFHLEDDNMIFTDPYVGGVRFGLGSKNVYVFCYINVSNVVLVGAPVTKIL